MIIAENKRFEKGFSIIELLIVVVIVGILAAIAVPNYLQAQRATNEASAVSSVSLIYRSELSFMISEGGGDFATIADLHSSHYIDETLGAGSNIKSGYRFEIDLFPSAPALEARFNLRARPTTHVLTGSVAPTGGKDFGVTEAGVIYMTDDNTPVTFDDITRLPQGTATPINEN